MDDEENLDTATADSAEKFIRQNPLLSNEERIRMQEIIRLYQLSKEIRQYAIDKKLSDLAHNRLWKYGVEFDFMKDSEGKDSLSNIRVLTRKDFGGTEGIRLNIEEKPVNLIDLENSPVRGEQSSISLLAENHPEEEEPPPLFHSFKVTSTGEFEKEREARLYDKDGIGRIEERTDHTTIPNAVDIEIMGIVLEVIKRRLKKVAEAENLD